MNASGWQPIETAPKDGTLILLFAESKNGLSGEVMGTYQNIGMWNDDGWYDPDEYQPIFATHWMPLPTPPA